MTGKVRTRIAPSPTGFLHLGTARTALYSWAYARHHGGEFVLRIEDTDVARSTQDSTDQILASMHWLGLDYDEGPIYQMQRLERYREVIAQMLAAGTAYHCYCTPAELDEMREAQRARGEKTLYDRRWRPEPGKVLPPVPEGVPPVVRFCNPPEGDVTWNDLVKGEITINNREIDDLIILRPDGVPTYNFAVVVDDWDMNITTCSAATSTSTTRRGRSTSSARWAPLPQFGHVPVILGDDGQKLSKRRGAVSVTAYEENGYLPEAMLNYLARLGWSHGDDELFTREQMVSWFDGSHLSKSPAQWDAAKLAGSTAQYIKAKADAELAPLVAAQLKKRGIEADDRLVAICALFKDRCETTVALADWAAAFYADVTPSEADRAQHVTDAVKPVIATLAEKLADVTWEKVSIAAAIKEVLAAHSVKMPVLAMPVRVLVMGTPQTPSLDSVLAIFSREKVVERLKRA
jgi:glutamyl-tRNA synthetase